MNERPLHVDRDAHSLSTSESYVVLDDDALAHVAGGLNWRYHAYQFMFNIASWNPAMLPAVF